MNQKQVIGIIAMRVGLTCIDEIAAIVRFPMRRAARVVDGIDDVGLRWVRRRWHGEVGITSALFENGEFVANAAALAGGIRVIKGPVSVDEAVGDLGTLVAGQESVRGHLIFALIQGRNEIFGGVVVMMQMHFAFAAGIAAQRGKFVDDVPVVLFDRIKERMTWADAVVIFELGDHGRPLLTPEFHPAKGTSFVGVMKRFKVIADRQHHIGDGSRMNLLPQMGQQPLVEAFDHETWSGVAFMMQRCKNIRREGRWTGISGIARGRVRS